MYLPNTPPPVPKNSAGPLFAHQKTNTVATRTVAAEKRTEEDERFSSLLGSPSTATFGQFGVQEPTAVDSIPMPAARLEEVARDALESMLRQIDDLAGHYLALRDEVLANGSPKALAELEKNIADFLTYAEKAMVDLVANVSSNLPPPPSPAMEKFLKFMGNDIWDGIREVQKEMERALAKEIGRAFAGGVDSTRYEETCQQLAKQLTVRLQTQADQIGVGQVEHQTFNPRQLAEVVAMNAQLQHARNLARNAATAPAPKELFAPAPDLQSAIDREDADDLPN